MSPWQEASQGCPYSRDDLLLLLVAFQEQGLGVDAQFFDCVLTEEVCGLVLPKSHETEVPPPWPWLVLALRLVG